MNKGLLLLRYHQLFSIILLMLVKEVAQAATRRCSMKKVVLKNFAISTGNHLCWSLFFNKIASRQACNFTKKRLQQRCFLMNMVKFLKTAILKNICEWLLLKLENQRLYRTFRDFFKQYHGIILISFSINFPL